MDVIKMINIVFRLTNLDLDPDPSIILQTTCTCPSSHFSASVAPSTPLLASPRRYAPLLPLSTFRFARRADKSLILDHLNLGNPIFKPLLEPNFQFTVRPLAPLPPLSLAPTNSIFVLQRPMLYDAV